MKKIRDETLLDKLLGYVLWNELMIGQTEESLERTADWMNIEFPIQLLDRYYLIVSGMERQMYRACGVDAYNYDDMTTRLWMVLRPTLNAMGFESAFAMQIFDDTKRLVYVLRSIEEKPASTVRQAAELIHVMLQNEFNLFTKGDALLSNFTVYSGMLRGPKEFADNFEQLCSIHQFIFFSPLEKVVDHDCVERMRRKTSQSELLQDVRDLFVHIHNADTKAASVYLTMIFCKLRDSLDRVLCNHTASTIITRLIETCRVFELPLEEIQRIDPQRYPTIAALERAVTEAVCLAADAIGKTQQHFSPLTRSAILYIKQHFCEDIALQTLADRAGVAPAYLSRIFNRDVEMSVPAYILHLRMSNAKKMLAGTSKSIAQIAQENGFSNASYFCKLFRREEGLSPAAFRDESRIND